MGFRLARTCKTISLMRGVRKDEDFSVMQGGQTEWRWFFRYFCAHRYPVNRCRLPFRKTHTSAIPAQPTAPPPFRLAGKARQQPARAVIDEKARRQLARANVPNGISCTQGRDITKEQDTRKGRILRKEASRQTEPHARKGTRCRKTTDWLCGCGFSRPGPVASQFIHRFSSPHPSLRCLRKNSFLRGQRIFFIFADCFWTERRVGDCGRDFEESPRDELWQIIEN